jgi:hypothetical protein
MATNKFEDVLSRKRHKGWFSGRTLVGLAALAVLSWGILPDVLGQNGQSPPANSGRGSDASAIHGSDNGTPKLVDKGANMKVWETTALVTNSTGVSSVKRRTAELGTGMHYFDGEWKASEAAFRETSEEFIADRVQARLHLKKDLNVGGAVFITTPDGKKVYSTPVALAIYQPTDGTLAVIGEITNCIGTLVESNVVVFENPFVDSKGARLCGSLVYKVGQATIEQDYVYQGRLDVQDYGFDNSCWLQVISEIQVAPEPDIVERPVWIETNEQKRKALYTPDLIDQVIGWGEFVLGTGRCYFSGDPTATDQPDVLVAKQLRQDGSRLLLTESVRFSDVEVGLKALPDCSPPEHASSGGTKFKRESKRGYASITSPPKIAGITNRRKTPQTASVIKVPRGLVTDWVGTIGGTVSTTTTLSSTTNWYVNTSLTCNGPLIIDGNTIVKFRTNTTITVNSTLTLRTGQYRPAVFTAVDDESIGDSLNGIAASWTGSINTNGYANPVLTTPSGISLSNCRFCYAKAVVQNSGPSSIAVNLTHSQLLNCIQGIVLSGSGSGTGSGISSQITLNNVLMANVKTPVTLPSNTINTCAIVNCTFDQVTTLFSGSVTIKSTNSVFSSVTSPNGSPSGDHNGFYSTTAFGTSQASSSAWPFQVVGASSYYLNSSCGFRGVGLATGIPASLVADLRTRTTYPPLVVSQVTINTNVTFSPWAQRNTGPMDLGYHIEPIDFALSSVYATNVTVSIMPGTVLATFGGNGSTNGLNIGQGATLNAQGTANQPIWVVSHNNVQEGSTTNWQRTTYASVSGDLKGLSPAPSMNWKFTAWSVLSLDTYAFRAPTNSGPINFQNCEFHSGKLLTTGPTLNFTNCLLERVDADIEPKDNLTTYFRNGLVYGGSFGFGPTNSRIADTFFDQAKVPDWVGGRGNTYSGYNAYITNCDRVKPNNASDLILATNAVAYKIGPLGIYYQATNSPLVQAGTTTADLVTLYHFTISTNLISSLQIKETNSVVDLSFHYVATDGNGVPADKDGDGIPDYLEDQNGNGNAADDPTSWTTYNSTNGLALGNGLQVFTPLK